MSTLFLARPSIRYKHSHLDAIREFRDVDHRPTSDEEIAGIEADFPAYVQHFLDWEDPQKTPSGWVTSSVYWLVVDEPDKGEQAGDKNDINEIH